MKTRQNFRLLVISSDTYPPTRVDVSVLFGEELASRGHQIDWILQSEAACSRSYKASWGGGTVWVGATDLGTSRLRRIRKHVLGILHDSRLFGRLASGDYDMIEVKDKFVSGIFAVIASRFYRKRFIYWLSYPFPEASLEEARAGTARYPFLYLLRGWIFRFVLYKVLLPAAHHVFVQSEQMKRDVAAEGVPMQKMTAVPMGIKAGGFSGGSNERSVVPAGIPCVLYLGTLAQVRRLDFLIRVFAKVTARVPDARLYLVGGGGDPSDEQILIEEATRLNILKSVEMVGQLPQSEAFRYVQGADVCVSPFYPTPILNSTSPTKLVEYMAAGKAVVANDHPEQRLVIKESGGGLCVPYEEDAFAAAIVDLLLAPDIAKTMGEKGRRYVESNRSYSAIADTVEGQLLAVVGAREKPEWQHH